MVQINGVEYHQDFRIGVKHDFVSQCLSIELHSTSGSHRRCNLQGACFDFCEEVILGKKGGQKSPDTVHHFSYQLGDLYQRIKEASFQGSSSNR